MDKKSRLDCVDSCGIGNSSDSVLSILIRHVTMKNPLYPLLSDGQFQCLMDLKLIQKNRLRDLGIKKRYMALRKQGGKPDELFGQLHKEYPKLKIETLKKIVYSTKLPEEL